MVVIAHQEEEELLGLLLMVEQGVPPMLVRPEEQAELAVVSVVEMVELELTEIPMFLESTERCLVAVAAVLQVP